MREKPDHPSYPYARSPTRKGRELQRRPYSLFARRLRTFQSFSPSLLNSSSTLHLRSRLQEKVQVGIKSHFGLADVSALIT